MCSDLRPGEPGGDPSCDGCRCSSQPAWLHRQPDRLNRPGAGPDLQGPSAGSPSHRRPRHLDRARPDPPATGRGVPARPAGPDRHDLGAYQHAIERLGQLIEQAQRLARSTVTLHYRPGGQPALTITHIGSWLSTPIQGPVGKSRLATERCSMWIKACCPRCAGTATLVLSTRRRAMQTRRKVRIQSLLLLLGATSLRCSLTLTVTTSLGKRPVHTRLALDTDPDEVPGSSPSQAHPQEPALSQRKHLSLRFQCINRMHPN